MNICLEEAILSCSRSKEQIGADIRGNGCVQGVSLYAVRIDNDITQIYKWTGDWYQLQMAGKHIIYCIPIIQ